MRKRLFSIQSTKTASNPGLNQGGQQNAPRHAPVAVEHSHIVTTPFMSRRILPPSIETQLRAACSQIREASDPTLQPPPKQKLDFDTLHRSMQERKAASKKALKEAWRSDSSSKPVTERYPSIPIGSSFSADRRNTVTHKENIAEDSSDADGEKGCAITDETTRSSRKRGQMSGMAHRTDSTQQATSLPSFQEHPKTRPRAHTDGLAQKATAPLPQVSDSANTSYSTPLTASTDRPLKHQSSSTAATSAARSPCHISEPNSKPPSRHVREGESSRNDSLATELMKQETDGKPPQPAERRTASSKTVSRSQSSKDGLRIHVDAHSGPVSRQSHHKDSSAESGSGSSLQGWRNWSWRRKESTDEGSNSRRSSSSTGAPRSNELSPTANVNLDRELPPLPSIDTYKPQRSTHRCQPPPKNASRPPHQKSASFQTVNFSHPDPFAAAPKQARISHLLDFDSLMNAAVPPTEGTSVAQDTNRRSQNVPLARSQTQPNLPTRSVRSASTASSRAGPPNFSRKISLEAARAASVATGAEIEHTHAYVDGDAYRSKSDAAAFPPAQALENKYHHRVNIVRNGGVSAGIASGAGGQENQPPASKLAEDGNEKKRKGSLKKMWSAMMRRRGSSVSYAAAGGGGRGGPCWMQDLERRGVKEGVMIYDEAAGAPVVKF